MTDFTKNIAASVIASVIVIAVQLIVVSAWKRRDRIKAKTKDAMNSIPTLILYLAFVFIGVIPIAYNSVWLYQLLKGAATPSRGDVFAICFASGSIAYWLWRTFSNLRMFSPGNFR